VERPSGFFAGDRQSAFCVLTDCNFRSPTPFEKNAERSLIGCPLLQLNRNLLNRERSFGEICKSAALIHKVDARFKRDAELMSVIRNI
jgi:hypothetical protein